MKKTTGTLLFDPVKVHSTLTDSVLVSFSGGKDSIVTLDLCCKYFKNVKAFFMQIVPDLEFQEETMRWYERKYNIEIMRLPHPDLSLFLRYGTFRNYDFTVPEIKFNDIYDYVRRETGIGWIAAGERINDSIVRRAMIKHSGTVDFTRGRFFPVAHWTKNEILQYIKKNKLLLPKDSQKLGFSFASIAGKELSVIKRVFPNDYKKILRYFPLAESAVKRFEIYGR